MAASSTIPADRRYALVLTMVHLGALATLLLVATLLFDLPSFVDGLPQGMLLIALGLIFHRGLRDDYVQGLWQNGTVWGFTGVILFFLFIPLLVGMVGDATGSGFAWRDYRVLIQWPAAIALLFFFAGFYTRLFRGSAQS
ncbi:hypothetical protein [Qipengyuania spongiae]|uniref:Transmembrane protein n=1 Tax=Qipengyuania spongiae TaxID=2909673 RepID=A0ABY5T1L3_9SPHN|nr:hypothetical protein [Qipengyuania spongiae]UVI38824.1 hypothetical protein L1F33_11300 [Qipengyuania spongiae]